MERNIIRKVSTSVIHYKHLEVDFGGGLQHCTVLTKIRKLGEIWSRVQVVWYPSVSVKCVGFC
jgi:hypothetical protein